MFWNNEYKVEDVFVETNLEEKLTICLEYYGVEYINPENSVSEQWAAYGYMVAMNEDLNPLYAGSMASMLSGFIGGEPVNCGTEEYINEDDVVGLIIEEIDELTDEGVEESKKVEKIVNFIKSIYLSDIIEDYERLVIKNIVCLTWTQNEKFQRIKGRTNHEKMQQLLKIYYEYVKFKLNEIEK